jgi:hypothetical protein
MATWPRDRPYDFVDLLRADAALQARQDINGQRLDAPNAAE